MGDRLSSRVRAAQAPERAKLLTMQGYWIADPDPSTLTHKAVPFPDFNGGDFQVGLAVHEWTRDYFETLAADV